MRASLEQVSFLKADLKRSWGNKQPFPGAFLLSPLIWITAWTLIYYRLSRAMLLLPRPLRILFTPMRHITKRLGQVITSTDVSEGADIGPGFFIAHNGTLVIGGLMKAGEDFFVRQGVTIGGDGFKGGHPKFGNGVTLGANAVVVGDISVGSNVIVGANSVVTSDVQDNVVVAGAPARVIREL